MSDQDPYRLHYAPDNASLVIRLALEELGVPYRTVLVDRAAAAQKSPDYLRLNPAGRIPTLETPDGPISETAAILLWLGERHGALMPGAGETGRAAFLNWLLFAANTLHPELVQLFYIHRYGAEEGRAAQRTALRHRIAGHLATLEALAARLEAPWFCGAEPSALDLYLAPMLRWAQIYPRDQEGWLSLAPYPVLRDMALRLEARPSIAAAIRAEGLGARPFTDPRPPEPPEGSAT
ncbi:glutathione S-transferase [Aquicoccus sp. SCR17]|nr:glutathione S-transferase [Carideicomes alvinocaridis]